MSRGDIEDVSDIDQDDLETTHQVLGAYKRYLEENEPHASNPINACEQLNMSLPREADDLG